ncbi:MAG: DUF2357 domain-containing protein [Planctomycetes bacterium]|nr:DUF2357 domain-containing protein [Planctomycetota bacterium]
MTSSSSSELVLEQGGRTLCRVAHDGGVAAVRAVTDTLVEAGVPLAVEVRRGSRASRGVVEVGDEVALVLRPQQDKGAALVTSLRDDFGEVVVRYVESDPADPESRSVLIELAVELRGDDALHALFEALVEELENVHVGLAREVLGRTAVGVGVARRSPRLARPEEDCQLLERVFAALDDALARIQRQPAGAIARATVRDRWRPGDRLAPAATAGLLADPDTVFVAERPVRVGRVRMRRSRLTRDVPEHRMLRRALEDLAWRARLVARHCQHCAERVLDQRRRWGGARTDGDSVFDSEHRPRLRRYEFLEQRALELADRFGELLRRTDFLAAIGRARSALRPTPLFLNGAGYRDAYAALCEAERSAAPLVSGEEFRIHFKSLSRLYEYWCFVVVVETCRAWFGDPVPYAAYDVVDEVYRPALAPGQVFRFALADGATLGVHYEPDIVPDGWVRAGHPRLRASLSTAPLRPDVLVELLRPGEPAAALVLDAKSTPHFDRDALWKPTDYRARIFDAVDGTQPVRQVFFLHRGAGLADLENLPGYLAGARGDRHASILGAVACTPLDRDRVQRVIRRFLATQGVVPTRVGPNARLDAEAE